MLTVYLDSQDYSVLSSAQSQELIAIREELDRFVHSAKVQFYYSGVVFSEAAPVSDNALRYAVERADLLSSLCGRNALVSFTDLLEQEVLALMRKDRGGAKALSPTGQWFRSLELDDSYDKSLAAEFKNRLRTDVTLNRTQKRAAERSWFTASTAFTAAGRAQLKQLDRQLLVSQISSIYPMKIEFADVMLRYVFGEVPGSKFAKALTESMLDPQWVMRWCRESPELGEFFGNIVRAPSKDMNVMARNLIEAARQVAANFCDEQTELGIGGNEALRRDWAERVEGALISSIDAVCKRVNPSWSGSFTSLEVAEFCPGINVVVRSVFSSYADNVFGGKKALPSDSQFADSMHAIYSPYVDLFRADAYMSGHIEKFVPKSGAQVVSRLRNLPAAIESKLREAASTTPL